MELYVGMRTVEELLYKTCIKIFAVFHLKNSEGKAKGLLQFFKFGIVGVSNTAISYALNIAVLKGLEPFDVPWDYIAGNCVAFFLSVLWSFYWNRRFVFCKEQSDQAVILKQLLRTYIAYGFTGIVLNNALSWLWINQFGISKYLAPLINLIVSVPLNYVINKFWAFR